MTPTLVVWLLLSQAPAAPVPGAQPSARLPQQWYVLTRLEASALGLRPGSEAEETYAQVTPMLVVDAGATFGLKVGAPVRLRLWGGEGAAGRVKYKKEGMKDPARKYQAQISGAPENYCYVIDDVRFDGYKDGVLLEAKGPGYAKQIPNAVENGGWHEGFRDMVRQAKRQAEVAGGTPIEWHFAEKEAADFVRQLFRNNKLGQIKVVHTPPTF